MPQIFLLLEQAYSDMIHCEFNVVPNNMHQSVNAVKLDTAYSGGSHCKSNVVPINMHQSVNELET